MIDFFFEYGLFAAKVITVVGTILIAFVALIILLGSRQRERESIEIEKINDKFDNMREALEAELLTKDEFKALKKIRKKEEKNQAKAAKKKNKNEDQENIRSRVFLLRFNGDMHASDVDRLREAVTAVLCVAKPEDEIVVTLDSAGGLVHN